MDNADISGEHLDQWPKQMGNVKPEHRQRPDPSRPGQTILLKASHWVRFVVSHGTGIVQPGIEHYWIDPRDVEFLEQRPEDGRIGFVCRADEWVIIARGSFLYGCDR